ncbi:amino acid adenylation domain-containing protein [Laceyella putida]|uniref:Amino acid adenylation domain-containing protein n=2 Tax=Laceyella putida TaxID=110101 RepID=A0ABW2RHM4_9BACL
MNGQHNGTPSAQLSDAKKKWLQKRLQEMKQRGSKWSIPKRETGGPAPLSPAQQRLWLFYQLQPGSTVYNLPTAVRLRGSLHMEILKKSIQYVVERHEILRTTFSIQQGQPVQIVHAANEMTMPFTDLSRLEPDEREQALRRLKEKEATQPFDLGKGPLLRLYLIRLEKEENVLLFNMHHIISDGWSMGIFVREVTECYRALMYGKKAALPDLPLQYADFAVWHQDWLKGEQPEQERREWLERLQGVPVLQLPTDRPRPKRQTYRGGRRRVDWPAELLTRLKAFCRQEGVTLFMTLLAAYKVLLYRYSGQTDFAVGSPVAGRIRPELEKLIGFFVNTLALRTPIEPDLGFREWLRRVKETCVYAYSHANVPFDRLVAEWGKEKERDLSYSPIFQTLFVLQQPPQMNMEGLELELEPLDTGASMFDLALSLEENGGRLVGFFEYNADLLDDATIRRMNLHLQQILEGALADPDRPLSAIPLLTDEELSLLAAWNETKKAVPQVCFHHLFRQTAEQHAQRTALAHNGNAMSYSELDERSNQLAHVLRKKGVAKGTFVAISLERSFDLIVAVLGVMKAGGAYIPLDPSYPHDRLAYMLEDSGAPILLTVSRLRPQLPTGGAQMICLDEIRAEMAGEPATPPDVPMEPDDLAYMIYTSGSTGKPKGVLVTHRGLGNVMSHQRDLFQTDHESRVLQFASFSFDASVFDFCMAFGAGATLCLADKEQLLPGPDFVRLLREERITHATLSPSVLNAMPDAELPDLKVIVTAGEACSQEIVNRFAPGRKFFNAYGPTEATIWASTKECRPNEGTPTIGRAISNVELLVLDSFRQPVPIGVPGELYIGGIGLARGYHGRPDLTAERFVPHPFKPEARLYKTGDLVRALPNGDLAFLGRVDDQVKIRGFRIELGELESIIAGHPGVKACAVTVREEQGSKRLAAYVVPHEANQGVAADLRDFLKRRVPDYMVPAHVVTLAELPMTANGKVDKKALPAPETKTTDQVVAARNQTEETLAEIWREVLRVPQIGMEDNFFELGGDSILAIQVVTKAKERGIPFTTKQLFEHQTIAELAKISGSSPQIAAEQGRLRGEVALTPIQRWFFEQDFADPHHWNQAVVFRVHRQLRLEWLKGAIKAVMDHHDALRLLFARGESGWKQWFAEGEGVIPLLTVTLDHLDKETIRKTLEPHQAAFQLDRGPLIRFVWLDGGEAEQCRLAVIAHHLLIDGVSWRLLMEDVERVYHQLEQGQPVQLPPKTTSVREWAETLLEYAQSDELGRERNFWLKQTGRPIAGLPRDGEGEPTVKHRQTLTCELPADETRALLQEVPQAYRTRVHEILLAALAFTLKEWSGESELLVDMESHGRQDVIPGVDLTRTVGWFTAKYPLRLAMDKETPGDLLKSVKEQIRAIPNQGFGFGCLRYLHPDENVRLRLKEGDKAEVAFNYLGQWDVGSSGEALFRMTGEPVGLTRSERGASRHLLEIDSMVAEGSLKLTWAFDRHIHHPATVERLADRYLTWLRALISHCLSPEAGGFTPSDFPEFGWDQEELDRITAAIIRTLGGNEE